MVGLPSFNYQAINAPGGIAAGLGGLASALVQAPQEKRRLALVEQERIDRRNQGEQDNLMRQQAMDDRRESAKTAAGQDEGFQKGGGLMGMLVGPQKASGRAPDPDADLIPSYLLKDVEDRVTAKTKAMQQSMNAAGGLTGALNQQPVQPAVIEQMRQNEFKALGYNPATKRRLGAGGVNAAGQSASPQQMPTPSAQPSAAPNQNVGQSDGDILELKKQHPQYASIPDDEFIRRVRAKNQGK
jgi:hypothetical protein